MKNLISILFISLFIFSCDSDSNPVGLLCESYGLILQDGLCVDECGEVNGDNSTCSDECGVINGDNSTCLDQCGVPNGGNSTCIICLILEGGVSYGPYIMDECGVCGGDNSTCTDDCGVPNGDNSTCITCIIPPDYDVLMFEDECGVCGGDNSTCTDDCGVPNGNNIDRDCSGECFGNNFYQDEICGDCSVNLWGQCYDIETTTILSLNNNQLTGEIPSEIGRLTNLEYLQLDNNQLTGLIPEEICNQGDSTPSVGNNKLCGPYPSCISQSDIDSQDTLDCPV